mmetsp:Transcript_24910/g.42563  ORF Transcript_24910/g.42563 Transcript_24910/m.42563 type:complete len:105 (+) Transcript_24910:34-348(+)
MITRSTSKNTQTWYGVWYHFGDKGSFYFTTTKDSEKRFHGEGNDWVGDFTITGYFENNSMFFEKSYPSHTIQYTGEFINKHTVTGSWEHTSSNYGKFEMTRATL